MYTVNSTDVRKEFSTVIDKVIREKPVFIKRTRDYMVMTESKMMIGLLDLYKFSAQRFIEEDGSVTLSLNEIDLMVNGSNENEAKKLLAQDILEYANDYYEHFEAWYAAPNRKEHLPYVLKAMLLDNISKIEEQVICQNGEN